jgi:hypothetical protein
MSRFGIVVLLCAMAPIGCGDGEEPIAEPSPSAELPASSDERPTVVSEVTIPKVDPCRDAQACSYHGRCVFEEEGDGDCVAARDEDCRASTACLDWGACSLEQGRCVSRDKDDCRASWHCRVHGRCTPKDGRCVVDGNSDCGRSERCKYHRQCEARRGRCVR